MSGFSVQAASFLARMVGRLSGACARGLRHAALARRAGSELGRRVIRGLARVGFKGKLAYALTGLLFFTLVASGFGIMSSAWRQILTAEAESTARATANFLTANLDDLPAILAGRAPSASSALLLQRAHGDGRIFTICIVDANGAEVYKSAGVGPLRPDQFNNNELAQLMGMLRQGAVIVQSQPATSGSQAIQVSRAIVPITRRGVFTGAYEVLIDTTSNYNALYRILSSASISFGLILVVAFGLPGIGFWLRTRQKEQAEHKLDFLSQYDALTALANRASLMRRLESLLPAESGPLPGVAVLSMDLDHFKDINGALGHEAGDQLLRDVANRLSGTLRTGEFVARAGGDEFIIVQEDTKDRASVGDLAQRLLRSFARPFLVCDQPTRIGPSIGVALSPEDGTEPETLIRNANLALQAVKANGRGAFKFYEGAMDLQSQRRRAIASQVRVACENGGFQLNFQPVYSLATGLLSGFESLVRLPQADGSMVPPSEFIPAAEELGLITKIGAYVLETACAQAALWPDDLTVAVNISPAEFREGNVVERVATALAKSGLSAERLEIEVTEGVLLSDTETTRRTMEGLKKLGVAIVLDDFGTGYSSLSYLWQFRFDKIKIDQSFVRAIGKGNNVTDIIRTIIALGRALDLRVTAEGVETEAQAAVLKAMRCDLVQGYLYGVPVAQPDVPAYVARPLPHSLAAAASLRVVG